MNSRIRSFIQDRLGLAKKGIGLPQEVVWNIDETKKEDGVNQTFWGSGRTLELPAITHVSGKPIDTPFDKYVRKMTFLEYPRPSTVEVNDTWLYGDSLLFTNPKHDKTILLNARYQEKALRRVYKKAVKKYKTVELTDKPIYLTFDNWATCYYHWLIDVMPRMLSIEEQIRKDGGVLLLPHKISPWMQEWLETLGLADIPSYQIDQDTRYVISKLYCPLKMNKRTAVNPLAMEVLMKRINERSPCEKEKQTERIFISRDRAPWRFLRNEKELFARLESHGFKKLYAEELNFRETQELFGKVEWLIASHGSGLTNMLFCQPGAKVVSLIQDDHYDEAFVALSRTFELEFFHERVTVNDAEEAAIDVDSFMNDFEKIIGAK